MVLKSPMSHILQWNEIFTTFCKLEKIVKVKKTNEFKQIAFQCNLKHFYLYGGTLKLVHQNFSLNVSSS